MSFLQKCHLRAGWLGLIALMIAFAIAPIPVGALQPFPPDGTKIVEVEVVGCEKSDPESIRKVMELKAGESFDATAVRRDLQAITDLGFYNPLSMKMSTEEIDGGVRLLVQVDEQPVVNSITFIGNITYTAERLERELDFKVGDLLPLAAKSTTTRSMRGFYAKGGFKSATARVSTETADEPNTVNVQIAIDEGEKIKIKDLIVTGNAYFSNFRIRSMATNSGSWLLFDNYYDDRAFDDDLRLIEERYRDAGFLDATAKRGNFRYNAARAQVSPEIVINEGPRYTVSGVELNANRLFTDEEVSAPFLPMIGKHFSGEKFREGVQKLRRLYGDQGYVNAEFNGHFTKNPEAGTVTLVLDVTENDVVYVGEVYIKKTDEDYEFDLTPLEKFTDWSSPGVKDDTVLREVKLKPGAKYRTADEVRTEDRLRNLGFFQSVDVNRKPTGDPKVDDVVIVVEEDPAAAFFSVTAGVGEVSGPSVGFNYVNPNLFGEAKVLNIGTTLAKRYSSFRINYLDRYFNDSDNSMEWTLSREFAQYRGYGERTYGTSVEFGHPYTEYVKGYLRVRAEHVRLERHDTDVRESMSSYPVFAVRGMVVRDLRNNKRWTTRGYMVSGGVETGVARNAMIKFLHSYEWYKSLDKEEDWVYAYSHTVGVQPYHATHVGISERFFLGGTTTLRGFDVRGIGPTDRGARDVHTGGSIMIAQRHELRHRFTKYLRGRLFVDAGMLEESTFQFGTPRVGTGAGISFDMGAFVVDVDLAAAAVRQSHDRTRVLHFRIRSNF